MVARPTACMFPSSPCPCRGERYRRAWVHSLCAGFPATAGSEGGDAGALASHESGYPMFKHAHIVEPHIWKARTALITALITLPGHSMSQALHALGMRRP